jgi:regulation of enolase protein 1 (concanavalin A-like superfamily)
MIRDGVAAGARHAFLFATPTTEKGIAFQRRPETDGISIHTAGPAIAPRVWLRLIRQGDVVTAAVRFNEADPWRPVGDQVFDGLPRVVNVGFAVTSHADGSVATATFRNIRLDSLDGFSTTWKERDIGDVGAAGSSTYDGRWTVNGAGADVWGTSDAFHFVWREVTGNFEFVTWVSFVEPVNVWTKAGVMMRESLDPGSRHAFLLATPSTVKGIAFQRRTTSGESTVHTAPRGPALAPGIRLRLVRTGDVITTYVNGPQTEDFWVRVGSETFSSLPETMLVGFAVTSHEYGTLARATFEDFALNLGSSEWISTDIGDVGAAGHSFIDEQSGPEFSVRGAGADVWGTSDAFQFLSREAVGDFDFSARANVENVNRWTKAGLMMRDGLSPDARHAFIIQTPTTEKGVAFQGRPDAGGSSIHIPGPANGPDGFLRLVRRGDVITAYYRKRPTDAWLEIGTQTFTSLPATVRIGFAVSSHVYGVLARGEFDNLALLGGIGP